MKILTLLIALTFQSILLASDVSFIGIDGPNCLNGALVETRILPYHRYTSNTEMLSIIRSPMCFRVNDGTESGDIGLILDHGPYATKDVISHAFVVKGAGLSFEKYGYSKMAPYQTVLTDSILAEYEVGINSDISVEYYRCIDMESFKKSAQGKLRSELSRALRELGFIEGELNSVIQNNSHVDSDLKVRVATLLAQLESVEKSHPSPTEMVVIFQLKGAISSIQTQLQILQ